MDFEKIRGVAVRLMVSLFPRNRKLVVYGGARDLFIDNAKHLFILYNEKYGEEYRHVWLTKNESTFNRIKGLGFSVVRTDSLRGIYTLLRAGSVIFDSEIDSFAYHNLSMGAVRICLWHGIGFKMVGSAVADNQQPYQPKGWFYEKYMAKHVHGDYFFSTCEMRRRIYSFSFLISMDRILIAGYPRTRCFSMSDEERRMYISRYETSQFVEFYHSVEKTSEKRIIYMPTFRDADKNSIAKAIPDWTHLNDVLKHAGAVMYLKVHRETPTPQGGDYSNIVVLDNSLDIYPLLPLFDLLISDYSSIMSDFALLKKPMLFYTYDLQDYIHNSRNIFRNFYTIHEQLPVVENFYELCGFIEKGNFQYIQSDLETYFENPMDYEVAKQLF